MKSIFNGLIILILISTPVLALEKDGVQVDVLAKSTTSWNGTLLQPYSKGDPEVTILKITIPPKFELPLHQHPVINAGVMIKGELTVVTENKKVLNLKAGDALIEVVDTWHYGKNEGDDPVEIIVFYAGIEGKLITIKK